ncbi:RNA-binding domain-containing protein, partial [Lindgomyces ingoldianus]
RSASKDNMMQNIRESSHQDRRVYVGNLSYDVKWHHLKDFMRQAGEVLFADVLMLPNGMSKGCGIVEYATREQAQNALSTLSNQNLMGRLVYVREHREDEPRSSNRDGASATPAKVRSASKDNMMQNIQESSHQDRRVYVGNLSYNVKWHHLKDFMRQAGEVLFADVLMLPNGMPKGCGIVEYATREQAQNALSTLSNQNLMGRLVYVREYR